jgi:hypothetical protein
MDSCLLQIFSIEENIFFTNYYRDLRYVVVVDIKEGFKSRISIIYIIR